MNQQVLSFYQTENNIFELADKYAIALGENADIPSLKRFVKDDSHLFFVSTVDGLLDILSGTINKEIDGIKRTRNVIETGVDDEWD